MNVKASQAREDITSFLKILKWSGPKLEPCGTPDAEMYKSSLKPLLNTQFTRSES